MKKKKTTNTRGRHRKDFIGGRQLNRKEALWGLGDPKTWPKEKEKLTKEFRVKPGCKDDDPLELL